VGNIDVDFATILVALSALTGVIWALDALLWKKKRLARDPAAKEPTVVEYARSFFPVIFAVLLIRSFLAEPFRIPSSSMMPTLLIGDFILVNKFAYGLRWPVIDRKFVEVGEPARGDVVVFRYPGRGPDDPARGTDYIKRVVGLPGDEVAYRDHVLYVNGEPVRVDPAGRYVGQGSGANMTGAAIGLEQLPGAPHRILGNPGGLARGEGAWSVPAGHYFVLGDNRDNSEDSRFWGFVPEQNLVGKAFLIWMNFDAESGRVGWERIGNVID
jgi:signal peptidase I